VVAGSARTTLCREDQLVIQQLLNPRHHVVDVSRCWQGHHSLVLVRPSEVEPGWGVISVRALVQLARTTTYLEAADIDGQFCIVQNSVMAP
jgi:hypothetical protein